MTQTPKLGNFGVELMSCDPRRDALIMTEKEDLTSAIKKEIPGPSGTGTQSRLLVIEGGRQDASRLCIKDTAGDIGWVSIKTKDGRPLLDQDLILAYNGVQVRLQGNRHRISARGAFS